MFQFRTIVSYFTNFKASTGSVDHVTKVLANLEKTNIAMTPKALCEEEAWQTSVGNFIYNVEETATNYRDITVPFLTAVYQVNFSKLPVYCLVQVIKPFSMCTLVKDQTLYKN